ncbi:DedA family protein [Bacillus methanolicus]|uniref:DedA family protein n=1 Tax=Bacillus methanolicus TaxID=1471 RepID=UPI0023802DF4|nr:DedA family protein [Bacillus methanolicus]MDE3841162.1 DedA family protein [Bacillus methanolicus]
MDLDFILNIIEEGGYAGLFFWLWLGIFGMPVPNEVIIMTVGFASSKKILNPLLTFMVTYSGILVALTTIYSLGRFLGRPLLRFLEKRKKFAHSISISLHLIEKYHSHSLLFSYFFPGIRNFVPFIYGSSRLSFKSFAFFAYIGALLWLSIVFTLGYLFGDHIDTIMHYGKELLILVAISFTIFVIVKIKKRKQKMHGQSF